jgi:hypothetical protein
MVFLKGAMAQRRINSAGMVVGTSQVLRTLTNAWELYVGRAEGGYTLILMQIQSRETTLEELGNLAEKGFVYVVLDACDAPAVPPKARSLGEERALSLYNGTAQEEYWSFAPYLCQADPQLLGWIRDSLWEEPWGIIALAKVDFAAMRSHFRKFLIVKSPEDEEWYFRFYDPRVLPVFLESSNEEELKEFFGPIQAFAVASPESEKLRLMRAV